MNATIDFAALRRAYRAAFGSSAADPSRFRGPRGWPRRAENRPRWARAVALQRRPMSTRCWSALLQVAREGRRTDLDWHLSGTEVAIVRAVSWTLLRVPGNGWEGFTPHVDLRGSARDGGPATTRALMQRGLIARRGRYDLAPTREGLALVRAAMPAFCVAAFLAEIGPHGRFSLAELLGRPRPVARYVEAS